MIDIRNLAKTLKAAQLMNKGYFAEDHNPLTNLPPQDLRDAARFLQDYPLIAEMIMRREVQADDTPLVEN